VDLAHFPSLSGCIAAFTPFRHPGAGRGLAGAFKGKVEIPASAGMTEAECISTSLDTSG